MSPHLQNIIEEGRKLAWVSVPLTGTFLVSAGGMLDHGMPLTALALAFAGGVCAGCGMITLATVRGYERLGSRT